MSKKPRNRVQVPYKTDPDLIERIDRLIDKLPFPTTRTAFIDKAIEEACERLERKLKAA